MTPSSGDVPGLGFITIPRAVLSLAAGVVTSVERVMIGDDRVRTSRGNAWEAMCADRERARQQDEVRRMVAELMATPTHGVGNRHGATTNRQVTVGSSPRSSASQASRVAGGSPAPERSRVLVPRS